MMANKPITLFAANSPASCSQGPSIDEVFVDWRFLEDCETEGRIKKWSLLVNFLIGMFWMEEPQLWYG
jgi:hypothetical protein